MTIKCIVSIVLVFAVFLFVGNAYPNGINPPRPSTATIVKATYKEISGGSEHEIYRTRIICGANPIDRLTFIIGFTQEQIDLMDIGTIILNSGGADPDGFIGGTLIRSNGAKEKNIKVQVKTEDTLIFLGGFKKDGTPLKIELTKCESVKFSSPWQHQIDN